MAALLSKYTWLLKNKPYVTNATSSFIIANTGDVVSQTLYRRWMNVPIPVDVLASESPFVVRSHDDLWAVDFRRSVIFASFGVLFGTPFWLLAYRRIEAMIPRVTIATAIQKGMMTWVIANATTPLFISYLSAMDSILIHGKRSSSELLEHLGNELPKKLTRDIPTLMQYSIAFWSIQWIPMFYVIPLHFRLVYASSLQIVWSGVASYVLHREDIHVVPGFAAHA
jgi:hypothetical protein